MARPDPKLLDELARVYMRAALDQLLAERAAPRGARRRVERAPEVIPKVQDIRKVRHAR